MRLRAIWCCLYFGLLPWQCYESTCHYRRGYFKHLWLNVTTAFRWATWTEEEAWHSFEEEVNPSWSAVWADMFAGGYFGKAWR